MPVDRIIAKGCSIHARLGGEGRERVSVRHVAARRFGVVDEALAVPEGEIEWLAGCFVNVFPLAADIVTVMRGHRRLRPGTQSLHDQR